MLLDASDEEKSDEDPLTELKDKLSELSTAHNMIQSRHHELMRAVNELEAGKDKNGAKLREKAALFKITSDAMIRVSKGTYKECIIVVIVHCEYCFLVCLFVCCLLIH